MIRVDTREQENEHITSWFYKHGIEYENIKPLIIGDYMNTDNPNVYLERKNSWLEFAGNCGKAHDRFKRELERLDQTGGKMYILIEEMKPLAEWQNKRTKMTGAIMQKIIDRWKEQHNIEFAQCMWFESAEKIYELLGGNK